MKQGHQYLEKLGVAYTVNPDGVTLVAGDVNVVGCELTELPFRDIVPWEVGGDFRCPNNQLTSLAGAPQSVGRDFWCYENQLTSLAGAPQSVGGDFSCVNNQLTSLAGAPQSVGGDFWCYENQLTSLAGAPQSVGRDFICSNNQLTSLAGAPQSVGRTFTCDSGLLLLNLRAADECETLRKRLAVAEALLATYRGTGPNQIRLESLD